ncbi:MAG TPA: hypothetical protein VIL74_05395 [Pyrinomonadaceae bacterium]|jgi:tetratricopeptide (TPR) repeat protein
MAVRKKPARQILKTLKSNLGRIALGFGIGLTAITVGNFEEARGQVRTHAGHRMGTVDFRVGCSPPAQAKFNEALAFLHHMTYAQAQEAFEQIAATDPRCAMAHWGVAMSLFQPLWASRPGPETLRRGWEEVRKAKSLPSSERERLFVVAAEAFFLEPESNDYWLRIRRWEQAAEKAYAALPDDADAAAFYALAHLTTTPSNVISRDHADRAAEILLRVYKQNPDHPGAMHYLVHANDVPGREKELLELTQRYETIAPRNPHALHMPTHIYTRLGDWNAVISGNSRAAEAALEYPAGAKGEYIWDEFAHAIEYMIYAYLQKGADDDAAAELKRLRGAVRLEPTFKTAFHLSSSQARFALERRDWEAAAALVPREPAALNWDRFTWAEAIVHFARGFGAARRGKINEAQGSIRRLEELEKATAEAKEDLFARNVRVLRLELGAWLAHLERQNVRSVALMREAAELETSTPKHAVTPAPTLPAFELLGDLLTEQKDSANALAAYRRSLELYPRRFNSLLGAARAANAVGDKSLADKFYKELLLLAGGGRRLAEIEEARKYSGRP